MSKHTPDRDPNPHGALVPLDRAHAALRRAAQLQADAIERLEQSTRMQVSREDAAQPPADGLARADIEAAAAGAGISPEFVRQALLEQESPTESAGEVTPFEGVVADRVLKTPQRTLELRRTMRAPAEAVLESMQRVFPGAPYEFTLVDCLGESPLAGGVLVFDLPRLSLGSAYTSFAYTAQAVDLGQVHVSIAPLGVGDDTACEVTLRGDLRRSLRRNGWIATGLTGLGAGTGALIITVAGLASGGIGPLVAAGAVAAAAGLGAASGVGYGSLYRYYLRKLEGELETLLRVVDTQARTGGGFRPPQPRVGPGGVSMAMLGIP